MSVPTTKMCHHYVGRNYQAADGGNYGIFIFAYLPEVNDFIVMPTTDGNIQFNREPYRLDVHKASYRYMLDGIKTDTGRFDAEDIGAGDGTLHGAIEYWQEEALRLRAELAECKQDAKHRITRLRDALANLHGNCYVADAPTEMIAAEEALAAEALDAARKGED